MRSGQLRAVQCLRALAAIMVMVGHTLSEVSHYYGISLIGKSLPWVSGVDIFFVISGFVIALCAHRDSGSWRAAGRFLRARAIRLIPMYYLFTLMMLAVLLAGPGYLNSATFDLQHTLLSFLFIPSARPDGLVVPVLPVGWTLNYEMLFYSLFALCLCLPWKKAIAACITLIVLLALSGLLHGFANPLIKSWTSLIVIEFSFGLAVGYLYINNQSWREKQGVLLPITLISSGVALLLGMHGHWNIGVIDAHGFPRAIKSGIPALLILAGATVCLSNRLDSRLATIGVQLGNSSYLLYLSHAFTLRLVSLLWLWLLPSGSTSALILATVAILACPLVAHLLHLHLELPVQRYLKQRFQ